MNDLFDRVHSLDPNARIERDAIHTTFATCQNLWSHLAELLIPDVPVVIHDDCIFSDDPLGMVGATTQDGKYYLPIVPDFRFHAIQSGANEMSANLYQGSADVVEQTLRLDGIDFTIDANFRNRLFDFGQYETKLVVSCLKHPCDSRPAGWADPSPKKWEVVVGHRPIQRPKRFFHPTVDEYVRVVELGAQQKIFHLTQNEGRHRFVPSSASTAIRVLMAFLGVSRTEAEIILGGLMTHPWTGTNIPFGTEYPGGKVWNFNSINWAFPLEKCLDWRKECPYWLRVMSHIFADLNGYLKGHPFEDGAAYGFTWLASLVQKPFEPTPYLFLFGPQNSGKSTLHEAFDLLVNRGVTKADRALTSQSDFNGELHDSILCVVEETDVARKHGAYAKIKEFVTGRSIGIRKMNTDTFMARNTTHWIQCANESHTCPVFPGDTRIQPIHVGHPETDIPKRQLLEKLKEEGPRFAYALANAELPETNGRLSLPIISTPTRQRLIDDARPEWIVSVPDFMRDPKEWTGTARELGVALLEAQLTGETPQDMRPIKRDLDVHGPYLVSKLIDFEILKQGKHVQRLTLRQAI